MKLYWIADATTLLRVIAIMCVDGRRSPHGPTVFGLFMGLNMGLFAKNAVIAISHSKVWVIRNGVDFWAGNVGYVQGDVR